MTVVRARVSVNLDGVMVYCIRRNVGQAFNMLRLKECLPLLYLVWIL